VEEYVSIISEGKRKTRLDKGERKKRFGGGFPAAKKWGGGRIVSPRRLENKKKPLGGRSVS